MPGKMCISLLLGNNANLLTTVRSTYEDQEIFPVQASKSKIYLVKYNKM
jgi:hypothetical protein